MAGGGMSYSARAPRSGVDQTHAVQGRNEEGRSSVACHESERMNGRQFGWLADFPFAAVEVGTVVRPGRVRNRTPQTEPDEKAKKPADSVRKKSPPARKAPARGRYVDEYASPAC